MAIPAANLLGAVIVLVFLVWVVPAPAVAHSADRRD